MENWCSLHRQDTVDGHSPLVTQREGNDSQNFQLHSLSWLPVHRGSDCPSHRSHQRIQHHQNQCYGVSYAILAFLQTDFITYVVLECINGLREDWFRIFAATTLSSRAFAMSTRSLPTNITSDEDASDNDTDLRLGSRFRHQFWVCSLDLFHTHSESQDSQEPERRCTVPIIQQSTVFMYSWYHMHLKAKIEMSIVDGIILRRIIDVRHFTNVKLIFLWIVERSWEFSPSIIHQQQLLNYSNPRVQREVLNRGGTPVQGVVESGASHSDGSWDRELYVLRWIPGVPDFSIRQSGYSCFNKSWISWFSL